MTEIVFRTFLILLGVLLGVFGAKMDWATFKLDDWETLVTGAMAVGAALYTVSEMRRAEVRQQDRHEEQLAAGKMSETRILLRAKAAAVLFESLGMMVDQTIEHFANQLVSEDFVPTSSDVATIYSTTAAFNRRIDDPMITDAFQYFDAETAMNYRILATRVPTLAETFSRFERASAASGGNEQKFGRAKRLYCQNVLGELSALRDVIGQFRQRLDALTID